MQKIIHFIKNRVIVIIELCIIALFIYWKYRLGITRYFDIDEYAHLHWTFNFFSSLKPYTQFLYFFPPLYLFILYPLFLIAGKSVFLLTLARFQAFLIFLFLASALFLLVKKIRKIETALLTLIIFLFLPLPSDKLLEVRPDNISTVLAMLGVYFLIKSLRERKYLFWSGFCYGVAIMIVPKVIFFIPAVLIVAGLAFRQKYWNLQDLKKFCFGFVPPLIFTLIFFIYSGNPQKALFYSTKFITDASKVLGDKFPMLPNLFFYPNDIFYGEWGVNPALILNLVIYIISGIWGIVRLVSFLDKKDFRDSLTELLVSLTFLANFIAYIKYFPMKHTQYFIAFAPLAAYYFSDFLTEVSDKLKGRLKAVYKVLFIIFLLFIAWRGNIMNRIKANWNNDVTFRHLEIVKNIVPPDEYIFDLYGETLFYKDPYFICCLSYGEYLEAFNTKLPSLSESLRRTHTKYIFPMTNTRINILPPLDGRFVKDHYVTIYNDPTIMAAGAIGKLGAYETITIDLITKGWYKIYFDNIEIGQDNPIYIDGKKVNSSPMELPEGDHQLKVDKGGEVKLVYTK